MELSQPASQPIQHKALVGGIVFMRVAFGAWFLWRESIEKFMHWTPETLPRLFNNWIQSPTGYDFYQAFLSNIALPNAGFFTGLVPWWELILSISLILGLAIRITLPLQIFANANFILGKTLMGGGANLDILTVIIAITLILMSAGRYFGIDGRLRNRFPKLRWL